MSPTRLCEFLAKLEADTEMAMSMVKAGAAGEAYEVLHGVSGELAAAYADAVRERTRYELEGKGAKWK